MSKTTVELFWKNFQMEHEQYQTLLQPQSVYFCDNQHDADECAELVQTGIKQATSTSIWWFEKYQQALPKINDLAIVTNWNGEPKAIIRTTKIELVKLKDITEAYAAIEGEGDKSLAYWQKVHWDYYSREMKAFNEAPHSDMMIVCEYFETIY